MEILIDDEYFTCTKQINSNGRVEYSFKMYKSIDDTVKRLVELYEIEKRHKCIK